MHTVGREFAADHDVTLETLMTYLPQTNEPGCSAGFAHGLVTGVAPEIDLGDPESSAAVCEAQIPATSAIAASTGSATPSCGSSGRI
jgi:hypothetical protein